MSITKNKNTEKKIKLCLFLFIFLIFIINYEFSNLNKSIDLGVKFLKDSQLQYGEFIMEACMYSNQSLDNLYYREEYCLMDSTTGNTAFLGLAINELNHEEINEIINKSSIFLLSEQKEKGIWNFFTNDSIFYGSIPEDTDDTAFVSRFLTMNNVSFENNSKLFEENIKDGLIQTWIVNESNEFYGEYDCNVNVNVLTYLNLINKSYLIDCNKLKKIIFSNDYECCIYCENGKDGKIPLFLFYNIAKLLETDSCFEDSKDIIISDILNLQENDGSFGSTIYTSFGISSLIEMGHPINSSNLKKSVKYLLNSQNKDGSWGNDFLFSSFGDGPPYMGVNEYWTWGSSELSTALALEALNKFNKELK